MLVVTRWQIDTQAPDTTIKPLDIDAEQPTGGCLAKLRSVQCFGNRATFDVNQAKIAERYDALIGSATQTIRKIGGPNNAF
jgi:hypothetical protein